MSASDPRPLPLRIRLPFGSEEEFIEKYGSNVARGGVFVATHALKPEGALLAFELVLADGQRLLRGEGVVQKVQVDEGGGRAGMTLRFTRLDSRSKALVDRLVAARLGLSGGPPELEAEPATRPSPPQPPPAPVRSLPDQELVLGIDLGTTNSRVAIFQQGASSLLPLSEEAGRFALPSVVGMDQQGRFLAGARAKAQLLADPESTVFGAKRLLGRRAGSRQVKELARRLPFRVAQDAGGDAGVELGGRVRGVAELMALLLGELKQAAQQQLGVEVRRAVICVPAYFNDRQRSAMLAAGQLAGLEVLRLLNEPSAVALAIGYGRGLARKRLLVYDLGGGTFDASVVQLTGDELEVVSTGGDSFLGGLDFDLRLAERLSHSLSEEERAQLERSVHSAQRLREAAEQAKIALSEEELTQLQLSLPLTRPDGAPVALCTQLTRGALEELTGDLVERTVEVTLAVLSAARLSPAGLDEVVLVGGQSRAPLVRRRVVESLGRPLRAGVDPQGAVALGAAIFGHLLSQKERGKTGIGLSEVLSEPIGIATRGGGVRWVLERNTRLPAEKSLWLPIQGGQQLSIAVLQGSSLRAEENEYLGVLHAQAEKSGELALRFAVDPDGRLNVSCLAPGGKRSQLSLATAMASDEVQKRLLAEAPLPGEDSAPAGGLLKGIRRLFGG